MIIYDLMDPLVERFEEVLALNTELSTTYEATGATAAERAKKMLDAGDWTVLRTHYKAYTKMLATVKQAHVSMPEKPFRRARELKTCM